MAIKGHANRADRKTAGPGESPAQTPNHWIRAPGALDQFRALVRTNTSDPASPAHVDISKLGFEEMVSYIDVLGEGQAVRLNVLTNSDVRALRNATHAAADACQSYDLGGQSSLAQMAMLLFAFTWRTTLAGCRTRCAEILEHLQRHPEADFKADVSVLAKVSIGLGKLANDPAFPGARRALARIADTVRALDGEQPSRLQTESLGNLGHLIRGFGETIGDKEHGPACLAALSCVAKRFEGVTMRQLAAESATMGSIALALGKVAGDQQHGSACRSALGAIAHAMGNCPENMLRHETFSFLTLIYLADGLNKLVDDELHGPACRTAIVRIAKVLEPSTAVQAFWQLKGDKLAGLAKAMATMSSEDACKRILLNIADRVNTSASSQRTKYLKGSASQFPIYPFELHELLDTASAFGRLKNDPVHGGAFRTAIDHITSAVRGFDVSRRDRSTNYTERGGASGTLAARSRQTLLDLVNTQARPSSSAAMEIANIVNSLDAEQLKSVDDGTRNAISNILSEAVSAAMENNSRYEPLVSALSLLFDISDAAQLRPAPGGSPPVDAMPDTALSAEDLQASMQIDHPEAATGPAATRTASAGAKREASPIEELPQAPIKRQHAGFPLSAGLQFTPRRPGKPRVRPKAVDFFGEP